MVLSRTASGRALRNASYVLAIIAFAGLAAPLTLADAPPSAAGPGPRNVTGAPAPGGDALADPNEQLPVRQITLYRSGVGYFQHSGKVQGDATIPLRFDADQINDILKSMVILDLDGGHVAGVGYGSKEPLARRLASFGVNIADNPSTPDLLGRLRGADIRLLTPDGPIEGTILGTESRSVAVGGQGPEARSVVMTEPFVNLVTSNGVRSVSIARVTSFELKDAKLAEELKLALLALAEQRNEKTATVDLSLSGAGERNVIFGYVHETPVWKTTYRLVLPEEKGTEPTLQGWAIVENTTDQDWKDVRLALVSGNPVGFTMDLHEPLFLMRPMLPVPVMAFQRPRAYESDVPIDAKRLEEAAMQKSAAARMGGRAADRQGQSLANAQRRSDAPAAEGDFAKDAFYLTGKLDADALTRYAPTGQAKAGEVGEQFRYDITAPVSISRQHSAMLPIVTAPIKGERLAIYNPSDQAEHPMRGVEITNSSGFELSPGPITVFDASSYAGDAQIGFTSLGQQRLLSYAVDLDVRALMEAKDESNLVKVIISNGMIQQQMKNKHTTDYRFINRDAKRGRTILVEQAKRPGWDVTAPEKPRSESETLRRFEAKLEAGKETKVSVVEERTEWSQIGVTSMDLPTLLSYSQKGKASQKVVDAVKKAADMQGAINDLDRQLAQNNAEATTITNDQQRIRGNMNSVDRQSDLWARYVKKLNEQETRLETLVEQRTALQKKLDDAKGALASYLSNLNVE